MKPWLYLPVKLSHFLSFFAFVVYSFFSSNKKAVWNSFNWRGLYFSNPLGIAGGIDKNADLLKQWLNLACGFIEVGTVSPLPQLANSGKIIDKNNKKKSLWNAMGFPSKGLDYVKNQLKKHQNYALPIFVNIGKNRDTPIDKAHLDYTKCMQELKDYADIFVINISSPNTKNLRDLFLQKHFTKFLKNILANKTKPTLLKLSPDLSILELERVLSLSSQLGIDGWVISNTMLSKDKQLNFVTGKGGVSGLALAKKSKEQLRHSVDYLQKINQRKNKLIVSVGGLFTTLDIKERLDMGADLVQVYSALVFSGPYFFKKIDKNIKNHLL